MTKPRLKSLSQSQEWLKQRKTEVKKQREEQIKSKPKKEETKNRKEKGSHICTLKVKLHTPSSTTEAFLPRRRCNSLIFTLCLYVGNIYMHNESSSLGPKIKCTCTLFHFSYFIHMKEFPHKLDMYISWIPFSRTKKEG